MTKLSDIAVKECVAELRAACRLPIDQGALDTVVGWLRPNFERILDQPVGAKRWGDYGQRLRNTGRYLGAFADFFGNHVGASIIGLDELTRAFQVVRADCTVRAELSPRAGEFCDPCRDDCLDEARWDVRGAEDFLRTIAPIPSTNRRAA